MKHALSILALLVAGCCGHSENVPPDRGPAACACDCPAGPPPAGQLSTFCLAPEHDGEECCRGSGADGAPLTGVCKALECVGRP